MKYFKILLFLIINLFFLILSSPISAQTPTPAPTSSSGSGIISDISSALNVQGNPFKYTDIGVLVSRGLAMGLIIASLLTIIYLLMGGIQWITSAGDKNNLESAKGKITNAVFGLVIVVAIWAIFLILRTFLGLPIGVTGNTGGGGGGGGGSTPRAWSCSAYPCDCCNLNSNVACCQQVGNLTSCVVGRFKNSSQECQSYSIDWNCWRENYDNLVRSGRLNPSTDACR